MPGRKTPDLVGLSSPRSDLEIGFVGGQQTRSKRVYQIIVVARHSNHSFRIRSLGWGVFGQRRAVAWRYPILPPGNLRVSEEKRIFFSSTKPAIDRLSTLASPDAKIGAMLRRSPSNQVYSCNVFAQISAAILVDRRICCQ